MSEIRILERVSVLLDAINERDSCGLKELSDACELAVSTTSRLLDSLAELGFVERERETKRYRLGPKLFRLVATSKPRRDIVSVVHPVLEWLVKKTGEDAGLAELQGTHAVIIDRVDGGHALKIIDVLGHPEPLHCGGFRKVLLAYQEDAWIESYIANLRFEKYTSKTIVGGQALWREIKRIRKQGYATSYGERLADAGGIAAPVFDYTGNIRATIQIVAPVTRLTPRNVKRYLEAVISAGRKASELLGGPLSRAETRHGELRPVRSVPADGY
ncbi:MAG: IclR family transcriptional regulator [Burkholderiaceae bacterium]|nr:IclR family transcriptional regulator [Burkholderiaceae bacterium]